MNQYTARKQKETKNANLNKIISSLSSGPKRFKDMENTLEMSQTTLSTRLQELEDAGIIERIIYNKNRAYQLTRKGYRVFDKIMFLIDILTDIRNRDGNYMSGGSPVQPEGTDPLFWPAISHLAADNTINDIQLMIPKYYLHSLQATVINDILRFIAKQNLKLDEEDKGKIILAVEIDYQDLVRTIKNNSVAGWKKLWKKEKNILLIYPQDSFSKSKEPQLLKYRYGDVK